MNRAPELLIPETPEDVTPGWLTAVLAEAGVLRGGCVAAATWERVGQDFGFTGLVGRVEAQYDAAVGDPPTSLVAKLPLARPDTASGYRARQDRDPALRRAYYERCAREARFYQEVGPPCAPRLYYASVDAARGRVILLLEDLRGRQGDVLKGCSVDEAAVVLEELAAFHARGHAPASAFPLWGGDPRGRQERFRDQIAPFLDEYGDMLPPDVGGIVERLGPRLAHVAGGLAARPRALIHADLHLDNVIFDARGDGSAVMLDWQTVSIGPPAVDLAMFLFGSLSVEDRRAAEADLLRHYLTHHSADGGQSPSAAELRLECALALLVLLAGVVGWLTTLDRSELNDRERALEHAALADGRLVAALLDHDVNAVLDDISSD